MPWKAKLNPVTTDEFGAVIRPVLEGNTEVISQMAGITNPVFLPISMSIQAGPRWRSKALLKHSLQQLKHQHAGPRLSKSPKSTLANANRSLKLFPLFVLHLISLALFPTVECKTVQHSMQTFAIRTSVLLTFQNGAANGTRDAVWLHICSANSRTGSSSASASAADFSGFSNSWSDPISLISYDFLMSLCLQVVYTTASMLSDWWRQRFCHVCAAS